MGSGDSEDQAGESDERNAIPTAGWRRQVATKIERFELGTHDVVGYEGDEGEQADADEEKQASTADDGSTQNVEDWGYSTRECENWTVYYRPGI